MLLGKGHHESTTKAPRAIVCSVPPKSMAHGPGPNIAGVPTLARWEHRSDGSETSSGGNRNWRKSGARTSTLAETSGTGLHVRFQESGPKVREELMAILHHSGQLELAIFPALLEFETVVTCRSYMSLYPNLQHTTTHSSRSELRICAKKVKGQVASADTPQKRTRLLDKKLATCICWSFSAAFFLFGSKVLNSQPASCRRPPWLHRRGTSWNSVAAFAAAEL